MKLKDTNIRNIKASEKAKKLFDGGGLYLQVTSKGSKRWRLKYRYEGKEKCLSLGIYPEVSLKEAREKRDSMRKLLADGVDPSLHRQAIKNSYIEKSANSFETIAREWISKYASNWTAGYAKKTLRRLEIDLFPWIGNIPITDLTALQLLTTLRRIEKRGVVYTAHRLLNNCGQVFRYAIATGRAERDVSADLRGALSPKKTKHYAATIEPKEVINLLRTIDSYQGTLVVACALRLAPLLFVRPGELRRARWANINFETAEWRYRVTKTEIEHIVPLSRQAIEILSELKPLTERSLFVFPSARSFDRPMSDNAILAAMRRLGIPKEEMSGHGFRAMARTILDEVLGIRPDFIEHQLAHGVRDPNGRAYNRTSFLKERKEMMQKWADYLDELRNSKADLEPA